MTTSDPPPLAEPPDEDAYNVDDDGLSFESRRQLQLVADARAARRLTAIEADQEIITTLQLQGFALDSPEWKQLAQALAEYAYSVFVAWLVTGAAYQHAARHGKGRGVLGLTKLRRIEGRRMNEDDACTIAGELAVESIRKFRTKTLMHPDPARRWRPDGGASLRTYFIGRCLMELPDVYSAWYEETHPREPEIMERASYDTYLDTHVANQTQLDELFADEPQVREMFELQNRGYSYDEIAELLSSDGDVVTGRAVATKMSRLRAKAQKDGPR